MALQQTIAESIHLILLDVQMPVMDGFETARLLAMTERTRNIPIVFLTAIFKSDAFIQQGYALGAVDYLTKPLDDNLLINRILFYQKLHQREAVLVDTLASLRQEVEYRRAVELDLMTAKKIAEEASQAKSVFLSTMSHELRTPLTAVLGFSEMLQLSPLLDDEVMNGLKIINRSGHHLLDLINDVLDLSKIEAGRITLDAKPFYLKKLLKDLTDLMSERAHAKGIALLIDPSSTYPLYIDADAARIRQVLINLVGNAIKCTATGQVTLRLIMHEPREDGLLPLCFEVEDTGQGIAAADIEHIFEPFVQVGLKSKQKGTGLGLAITHQFICLMGGSIEVESHIGQGSLFRMIIPVKQVNQQAAELVREGSNIQQPKIVGLAKPEPDCRLMVVEDQEESRQLLSSMLRGWGFTVCEARNGAEAVQEFTQCAPRLIWMDVRMPVMDGLAASRKIRSLPGGESVIIIAFTASVFQDRHQEMLDAGMNEVLGKPYKAQDIAHCLEQKLHVKFEYKDK